MNCGELRFAVPQLFFDDFPILISINVNDCCYMDNHV